MAAESDEPWPITEPIRQSESDLYITSEEPAAESHVKDLSSRSAAYLELMRTREFLPIHLLDYELERYRKGHPTKATSSSSPVPTQQAKPPLWAGATLEAFRASRVAHSFARAERWPEKREELARPAPGVHQGPLNESSVPTPMREGL